jgi:RNA polymerase sigma-70 factor (ECF subfamily)
MRAQAAWEGVVTELVAQRGDALLRYATLLCGSRDDAADLVQDALVRTFGRLRNGFSVESAEAYVRRAILNAHLDGRRRSTRWRRIAPLEYRPDEQPSPALDSEQRLDLHEELRRLTPRERACLVLRYYDDLKRYLSDGLAKMAISLADDGTVEDRLLPPSAGARPASRKGASRAQ